MAIRKRQSMSELNSLLARDHNLHGGVLYGLDGHFIELQARAVEVLESPTPWRYAVKISGMARGAIHESLDRISGAFAKYGIENPSVHILINLAPADIPKEGTWLDLPIAIIMLQAAGFLPDIPESIEREHILVGECGLHGDLRRVPGILSIAYNAIPGQKLVVPRGNEKECALILAHTGHDGCKVLVAETLLDVIEFFKGKKKLSNALRERVTFKGFLPQATDFATIRGQEAAKEAAVVAAAGGHNILMVGPPGEGKSLLAGAIRGILPPLETSEKVQLTRIYSAYGEISEDGYAITERPYRAVHHTASKQSLVGGGSAIPRPGEITLAHLGILFLDEIAEFSRSTLDSLRQPIESGRVTISRVGATIEFPSRFTLVAAMNPCPCGFYGSDQCVCRKSVVRKYHTKISGPILDRIDLQVELKALSTEERISDIDGQTSTELRNRVMASREIQLNRFKESDIPFNAAIPGGRVREYAKFSDKAFEAYKKTIQKNRVSTRSMDRLAKVSRTIADLEGSTQIEPNHIDSAARFVIGGVLRDQF